MDMWQTFMESIREALETLKTTELESCPSVKGWNQSPMFQANKNGIEPFLNSVKPIRFSQPKCDCRARRKYSLFIEHNCYEIAVSSYE